MAFFIKSTPSWGNSRAPRPGARHRAFATMKRATLIIAVLFALSARASDKKLDVSKIQMVDSFPDFTVEFVTSFPGPVK
jgi:hypothetical protein